MKVIVKISDKGPTQHLQSKTEALPTENIAGYMFSKIWLWHTLFLDRRYSKGMQMEKLLPPGVRVPLQNCLPEQKQLVLIYSLIHMQISLKSHTQMILHWELEHLRRSIVYHRMLFLVMDRFLLLCHCVFDLG
jgi:hypothetical protein